VLEVVPRKQLDASRHALGRPRLPWGVDFLLEGGPHDADGFQLERSIAMLPGIHDAQPSKAATLPRCPFPHALAIPIRAPMIPHGAIR